MPKTKVSIVLSVKNETANLEHCLASLSEQRAHFPYDVHVVDNQSQDASHRIARDFAKTHKNFHVWRQKKAGSPAARNLGARKANGEILVFTEADCRFPETWLEEITRPLRDAQRLPIGAVAGFTESEFPEGKKSNIWERYTADLFQLWDNERTKALPGFLPWAPANNLAVRRELFLKVGGFEEAWKNAAYDIDFCWRMALCGYQLAYAPKAHIFQKRRTTLASLLRQIESYAFYNQLLLRTYEKSLNYHPIATRKERLISRALHALQLAKATKSLEDLSHRGIDSLVKITAAKGQLRALYSPLKATRSLQASRQGVCHALEDTLPKNYRFLHDQGWCYWKDPANQSHNADLVLFQVRERTWLRLNDSAWRVWEIKTNGGDNEQAAEALGTGSEIISDVDNITLDLRRMELLP